MANAFFPWHFLCSMDGQTPGPSTIDKYSTGPTSLYPPTSIVTIPRRNRAIREQTQTSSVHLEYTSFMRGVDVANQLRALYPIYEGANDSFTVQDPSM
jgi:hypothetical protein